MLDARISPTAPLPPAPGSDEHVSLELVNSAVQVSTRGATGHELVDLLVTPDAATGWLIEHGLAPQHAQLAEYCTGLLTGLRGDLRQLYDAVVHQQAPAPETITAINHALTRTPTVRLLAWNVTDGFHDELTHPTTQVVEHAIATIAAYAVALVTGPDAALLAACAAQPCNRYLLRTHARRHWCSTRCGDRVRAARCYARRSEENA
jgi:predicted RNA-binding Zn ribbon-like protein